MIRYFTIFLIYLSVNSSYAQLYLDDVDFKLVPYRSICSYLENLKSLNIYAFSEIHPSCQKNVEYKDYGQNVKHYKVKENIDKVWETYKSANPSITWQSRMVNFGFLYSRNTNSILYFNDGEYSGLTEGQIIYVNLKLLKGMYNLATAFEVIEVDDENKTIEFSYIEGGKARGIQIIQFSPTEKGETIITHRSYFKSDSKFRDKYLYSPFHKKIINQFHHNVRRLVYKNPHDETLFSGI